MKIIKKDLKFDMVLDGEKINSLEELREHPSTELLDLQKAGSLARWVRNHGGTTEAEQLKALELTKDSAQDLYNICKILCMDVELADIVEALEKQKEVQQQNEEVPLLDTESNLSSSIIIEDPHIEERKKILFNVMQSVIKKVHNLERHPSYDKYVLSNIEDFKYIYQDTILIEDNTEIVKDTSNIYVNGLGQIVRSSFEIIVLKDDEISVELPDSILYFQPSERVFFVIKGKNVRIINKNYYSPVILVLADNIYIDRLNGNNILLVANNIFIGSTRTSYSQELPISIESGLVCAKNILSIGKTWAIPP